VAKQPEPVAQPNGFEHADWKMQLSAYQNEGVSHVVTTTVLALCGGGTSNNTGSSSARNGGSARCKALFKYIRSVNLTSSNTSANVNRRTALKMFPWMREDYAATRRVNNAY
jgi:hypothetical protein